VKCKHPDAANDDIYSERAWQQMDEGITALNRKNYAEATSKFSDALASWNEVKTPDSQQISEIQSMRGEAFYQMAVIYRKQENYTEALENYRQAANCGHVKARNDAETVIKIEQARMLMKIGRRAFEAGDYIATAQLFSDLLKLRQAEMNPRQVAEVKCWCERALLKQGKTPNTAVFNDVLKMKILSPDECADIFYQVANFYRDREKYRPTRC
jgi:tetratricopeptide (TPR) repeat protein